MSSIFRGIKQSEAINWGVDLVSLSGWGDCYSVNLDYKNNFFIFEIKNSTAAKYHGKADYPVDHLFRGLVSGGVSYITKSNLECIEIKCLAKGD